MRLAHALGTRAPNKSRDTTDEHTARSHSLDSRPALDGRGEVAGVVGAGPSPTPAPAPTAPPESARGRGDGAPAIADDRALTEDAAPPVPMNRPRLAEGALGRALALEPTPQDSAISRTISEEAAGSQLNAANGSQSWHNARSRARYPGAPQGNVRDGSRPSSHPLGGPTGAKGDSGFRSCNASCVQTDRTPASPLIMPAMTAFFTWCRTQYLVKDKPWGGGTERYG